MMNNLITLVFPCHLNLIIHQHACFCIALRNCMHYSRSVHCSTFPIGARTEPSGNCWLFEETCLLKQFSLLEIISTAVLLAIVVVDLSSVFHAIDSAALQVAHRCTDTCSSWNASCTSCTSNTLLRRCGSSLDSDLRTPCQMQVGAMMTASLLHCLQGCVSSTPSNKGCSLT